MPDSYKKGDTIMVADHGRCTIKSADKIGDTWYIYATTPEGKTIYTQRTAK